MKLDSKILKEKLKIELTERRYEHTLGVADTAACLAMRYGYDIYDAYIAGLLHDNAKCLDDQTMLERCKAFHIEMNDVEMRNPYLLHAKVGAYQARKDYFVLDENILSAITYHTTGRPDMTLLEQIIFVADYIEPNRRPLPNLDEIRRMAFSNLEQAVFLILESTLSYLQSISSEDNIDRLTVETYEFYKKLNEMV